MDLETSNVFKSIISLVSGAISGGKLQILIYHRVLSAPDPLQPSEPTVDEFRWQSDLLANHFNVIPLVEAVALLKRGELPPRSVCITFDDGYADNYRLALPILKEYNIPATVFVATGYLDGGIMFNDAIMECIRQHQGDALDLTALGIEDKFTCDSAFGRLQAFRTVVNKIKYLPVATRNEKIAELVDLTASRLPDDLMMTTSELISMANAGVDIGAHTITHPILMQTEDAQAREEIFGGREWLEKTLGAPIELFAYPNGVPGKDYDKRHPLMLEELGFKAAVTTKAGHSTSRTNRFELPRFTPWDKYKNRFLLRLLRNYF